MDIIDILKNKKGFIAALDQSGGSSKKTLVNYGYDEAEITNDSVMFEYIHEMRSRLITHPSFNKDYILGTILFKNTMESKIGDKFTAEYLLEDKNIVSFLKIDNGLEDICDCCQLMKDIPDLEEKLSLAKSHGIVGTKMRSVIKDYNEYGIKKVIEQQFKFAKIIVKNGLVPIIEPEVDINAPNKKNIESFMKKEILMNLSKMQNNEYVMFKFTLPELPNFYDDLLRKKNVLRIVALSGGYSRDEACQKLKDNKKMIASFSRALLEGLNKNQTDEEYTEILDKTVKEIYDASVNKNA